MGQTIRCPLKRVRWGSDRGLSTRYPPRASGQVVRRRPRTVWGCVPQSSRALTTGTHWPGPGLSIALISPPSLPPWPVGCSSHLGGGLQSPLQLEDTTLAIKVRASQLLCLHSHFHTWYSPDQLSTPRRWREVRVEVQGSYTSLLHVCFCGWDLSQRGSLLWTGD